MNICIDYDATTAEPSWGRYRSVATTGLYIGHVTKPLPPDSLSVASVDLCPINSRGGISSSCRLEIAVSSIPEIIKALQQVYDQN